MENSQTLLLAVVAGFSIGHILFLAVYMGIRWPHSFSVRCLSLLLCCLAVRVSKSVFLLLYPEFQFASVVIALGVIAMSAIGPLIWLYVKRLLNNAEINRSYLIHFIPGIILSLIAFRLNDRQMFQVYQVTVYHIIGYIIYSTCIFHNNYSSLIPAMKSWLKEFIAAGALMAIVFLVQLYSSNLALYISVSAASALILYILTLRAALFRQHVTTAGVRKRKAANPLLLDQIGEAIIQRKLYLDPSLTVYKLSDEVKLPVRVVSEVINDHRNTSFSDYINEFRIREAETKLVSEQWAPYTVEAIAYACGFNSLSAFYNSFKKIKNVSPARFRKENSS
jgi:AraC-like DNA-binding protein